MPGTSSVQSDVARGAPAVGQRRIVLGHAGRRSAELRPVIVRAGGRARERERDDAGREKCSSPHGVILHFRYATYVGPALSGGCQLALRLPARELRGHRSGGGKPAYDVTFRRRIQGERSTSSTSHWHCSPSRRRLALRSPAKANPPAARSRADRFWPQWRGPFATGVSRSADAADRVERDEEHPLEGRNPRARLVVAGHLGRPDVRAVGGADRRRRGRVARAARRAATARSLSLRGDGARSAHRQDRLGAHRARGAAARGDARRQRHLRVELGDHRRPARLRLVRVAGHVRLRHGRHAALVEGPRRQEDAQPVRRGQHAGPRRRSPRHRLGSNYAGRVVRRVAGRVRRTRVVARLARRDRHVGDAARGRARGPRARRSCRG